MATSVWHEYDRIRLSDDAAVVDVTIGSADRWDRAHLRRLRQSADLPGLVPVIDADISSDGKPFAVTPAVDASTLGDRIPSGGDWADVAAITEAAARATHEAHLRGLFHGALSPDQIYVVDDDIAVSGIGLGLGGVPRSEYAHWVSPEVLDGGDATERSDVYSLGKILEASLGDSLDQVPRSVRRLIMWSGSETPEARPPSALEFASILAEALGDQRRTYGPAFVPTVEANQIAATASGAVASLDDGGISGAAVAAGAAGAAAVGAASILGGDDDIADNVDLGADLDDGVDADELASALEADDFEVDDATDSVVEEVDAGGVTVDELIDDASDDESVITRQLTEEVEPDSAAVAASAGVDEGFEAADGYEVPAAQTVELDEAYDRNDGSNRAGILLGVILAAGLVAIGWGLLSGGGDDEPETASDTTEAAEETGESITDTTPTTTAEEGEAPTTAADDGSESTETDEGTESTDPSESSDSEEGSESAEVADGPSTALVDGPISADEAGIQLVHGIPGQAVDLYIDGEAQVPGFDPGAIAGPAELDAGSHEVGLYAAAAVPAANATDRTDETLAAASIVVGSDPTTIVAHLDADGMPTVSSFVENFDQLDPGTGRLVVRHLAAVGESTISIDGEEVAGGSISSGQSYTAALPAGLHTVSIADAAGNVLQEASISIGDGEMASISMIGSEGAIDSVVQRYTGLESAPVDVPTGTGGLLDMEDSLTGLYLMGLMAALMAVGGGILLNRRNRVL